MRFTDADFAIIDDWTAAALETLKSALDIEAAISSDIHAWKTWVDSIPADHDPLGVSATLDPDAHDLSRDAFWIAFSHQRDGIIACHCDRLVQTDDLLEEVRSGRLFRSKSDTFARPRMELVGDRTIPTLAGRIQFGGGTWVHPDHRGTGLSNIVARLRRNFGLQEFLADYYVTLMPQRREQFGTHATGLKRGAPLSRGFYTGRGKSLDVHLFYMHRLDMLAQMQIETAEGLRTLLNLET